MHPFEQMISVIGPIVGGIIVLALFFKVLGWFSGKSSPRLGRFAFEGVLDDRTLCTVHVGGGSTYENVKLVGFTDSSSAKGPFPFELSGMVILEHSDGRRTLIQAKNIRTIEVAPKAS